MAVRAEKTACASLLGAGGVAALVLGILLWGGPAFAQDSPDNAGANGQSPQAGGGASAAAREPADPAAGRISGKIVDQTGVAVTGARVELSGQDQASSQEMTTGEDGQYRFANVAPGPFRLSITANGFAAQEISGTAGPERDVELGPIALAVATVNTEIRVVPRDVIAEAQLKEEEKQRALGFIPNYYVSYVPNALPLLPRQKFELAWKTMVDPVTFGLTGAIAGLQQAQNDFSGYGQGAQGYGKRYAAAYGDMATSTLIGGAILPSLFKQDPRYFYKGTGSKRSRVLYAIANSVICKGDNGRWQANYSAIVGGLASAGISNLYYPAKDREGAELTIENTLIGIGATAAANILQEFVIKKFTPSAANHDPGKNSKAPNPIAKVLGAFVHEGD